MSENKSERKTKGKNLTVEEAGKMGGQRVRKLVQEGKEHEEE
ncbi:MAG: small, acid-soluble spore protein, alpha/beta type [Candidatus Bathyarchaeota archaeon]|nr:small, acid-soluble spore protein, alpha/beta type [Candidatus Bathyarchaeota archaeon]